MITKSHSEEDLKTLGAKRMKGKGRVKPGRKAFLTFNVTNMFPTSCHLPAINSTSV
jgi:hypothetical protein